MRSQEDDEANKRRKRVRGQAKDGERETRKRWERCQENERKKVLRYEKWDKRSMIRIGSTPW